MTRRRAPLLAAATCVLSALACHNAPTPSRPRPATVDPCASRPSVAVSRARLSRRASKAPGSLVVRLTSADSMRAAPSGPVRLTLATAAESRTAATETRVLPVGTGGVARSGALPPGRYVVEAAGRGFQARRFTLAVRPGATDTLRFRLAVACTRRASR